ncbi:MAG: starch-binding protein [Ruminococcus sp.]|nr:starch-binding protein [Ruminococcus sp.]
MKLTGKFIKSGLSVLLALTIIFSMLTFVGTTAAAVVGTNIDYSFSGRDADTAGYAEGTVTLSSDTAGKYYLYWANDNAALNGYYAIDEMTVAAGGRSSFKFDYHTAIPAGATKIIACTSKSDLSVQNAAAVYDIPEGKRLGAGAGSLLYTFNSYSDVHIDMQAESYYKNGSKNWAQALKFSADKGTDFIVSSGDMITNAEGEDAEWDEYERILSESDYVKPVWESDGNHDLRKGSAKGLKAFVRASGTDSTIANYDANKPYYYVTEEKTGDIFIFMALESEYNTSSANEFSASQMTWLTNLLNTYYGTGVNIYIVEHAPIWGFGAGDRMGNPYYKAHLSEKFISTVQFKSLLQKYPKLIFMSGHTHEDYAMGYNYSNENNTACHMIHNSAVAGSTWAEKTDTSLDYNDGYGYNSQGYYVEVYENQVVYYGANLTDELIYPAYCYIMDGSRGSAQEETNATAEITTADPNSETAATGSTLPAGIETKRVYFANTVKWAFVDCYSWSDSDKKTCIWPGYAAVYCATTEQGVDLYYCDIPASHTQIIWNNAGNAEQVVDTRLDGVNDFFTPSTSKNSNGKYPVTASVWNYEIPTDPDETTETSESSAEESSETPESSESIATSESSENTTASESEETDSSDTSAPTAESSGTYDSKYKLGDVDFSGEIDINDVTAVQKYLAEMAYFNDEQLVLADADGDGHISIKDATLIQMLVTELITDFDSAPPEIASISGNATKNLKNEIVPVGATTLSAKLIEVKTILDGYYTFSSYDQYQALKEWYYKYKNNSSVNNESTVVAESDALISKLNTIAEHIGVTKVNPLGDTYYFENTYDWSAVYVYAFKGSSNNSWPGVKMQKVGTNYGHDVYGIKLEYAGQYSTLIFNNGKNSTDSGSGQTIDIELSKYNYNCFYISGGKNSEGKYPVGNFNYNSPVEPTVKPVTSQNVADNKRFAMCYYNGSSHAWATIDTFLKPQGDGTYALDFVTKNSDSISMCIYDNSTARYYSNSDSANFVFEAGVERNYSLVGPTSARGKSITVNGMSSGLILGLVYNPNANTLKITCKGSAGVDPIE